MTLPFSEGYIARKKVLKEKDAYILKPDDSYASNGVWAGVEYMEAQWKEKVDQAYGRGYICQDYCPQYSTENIDFAWGDGIIASHRNERTQATYVVSDIMES